MTARKSLSAAAVLAALVLLLAGCGEKQGAAAGSAAAPAQSAAAAAPASSGGTAAPEADGAQTEPSAEAWAQAAEQYQTFYLEHYFVNGLVDDYGGGLWMEDLDFNGMPELIVPEFAGSTGMTSFAVYTIEDGDVVKLTKDKPLFAIAELSKVKPSRNAISGVCNAYADTGARAIEWNAAGDDTVQELHPLGLYTDTQTGKEVWLLDCRVPTPGAAPSTYATAHVYLFENKDGALAVTELLSYGLEICEQGLQPSVPGKSAEEARAQVEGELAQLWARYTEAPYDYEGSRSRADAYPTDASWVTSYFARFIPDWTPPEALLQSEILCGAYADTSSNWQDSEKYMATAMAIRENTVTFSFGSYDRNRTCLTDIRLCSLQMENGEVQSATAVSPERVALVQLCAAGQCPDDAPAGVWTTDSPDEAGVVLDCMSAPILLTGEGGRTLASDEWLLAREHAARLRGTNLLYAETVTPEEAAQTDAADFLLPADGLGGAQIRYLLDAVDFAQGEPVGRLTALADCGSQQELLSALQSAHSRLREQYEKILASGAGYAGLTQTGFPAVSAEVVQTQKADLDGDNSPETIELLQLTDTQGQSCYTLRVRKGGRVFDTSAFVSYRPSVRVTDLDLDHRYEVFFCGDTASDDYFTSGWTLADGGLIPLRFTGDTRPLRASNGARAEGELVSSNMTTVTLRSYTHLLGSYYCERPYAFTGAYTLAPLATTSYTFLSEGRDLTLLAELRGEDPDTGAAVTLPAGTVLRVSSSDCESWVVLKTADGLACKVSIALPPEDRDASDMSFWYVNGRPETDYFGALPYAG